MNRKLLTVGVIAIVLLLSISVISAADSDASDDNKDVPIKQADNHAKQKTISVKVKWTGDTSKIPERVTVNLLRDGTVVDTAVLSPENSWSTTFKVNDDGNFKVSESQGAFSVSVKGNADSGFVITNKIASDDVISAEGDDAGDNPADGAGDNPADGAGDNPADGAGDNPADGAGDNPADGAGDNTADDDGQNANPADGAATAADATNNETGDTNGTNETDDNATATDAAPVTDSTQNNGTAASNNTDTSKKSEPVTKEIVKQKIVKHTTKKPTKVNHKTGIPMVILVVAVMCAAFVPLVGRKR